MISLRDYLGKYDGHKDLTPARYANAQRLLGKVNSLMAAMMEAGVEFPVNPATKCQVGGSGNGGFRPQDCPVGAPGSAHKQGLAVDIYDPHGDIDDWLNNDVEAREIYTELELYFEALSSTVGWSHWSLVRPVSGRRFFIP